MDENSHLEVFNPPLIKNSLPDSLNATFFIIKSSAITEIQISSYYIVIKNGHAKIDLFNIVDPLSIYLKINPKCFIIRTDRVNIYNVTNKYQTDNEQIESYIFFPKSLKP